MDAGLSIHPRNWRDGNGVKLNTAKAPKPGRKRERKLLAKFDARQRAWHAIDPKDQKGFRKPGSRKMAQ